MSRKNKPQVKVMLHPKTIKEIKFYHSQIQEIKDIDKLGNDLVNVLTLKFLESGSIEENDEDLINSEDLKETKTTQAQEALLKRKLRPKLDFDSHSC